MTMHWYTVTSATTVVLSEMRAGDDDRDKVLRLLEERYAQGYLTQEELQARIIATLTAKAVSELTYLTRDLPEDIAGQGSETAGDRGDWWFPSVLAVPLTGIIGTAFLSPGPITAGFAGTAVALFLWFWLTVLLRTR